MTSSKTVLLVMDFQHGIASRYDASVAEHAAEAADAARRAKIPVMFVRVAMRPGFPEVADNNRAFSAARDRGVDAMTEGNVGTELLPVLGRREDEPIITKRRFSAFAGSDLDVLLRAAGAERLVMCGVSTSGVVLSTFRQAIDMDFDVTVLADACADADPVSHDALLSHIFPAHGTVTTAAQWISSLA